MERGHCEVDCKPSRYHQTAHLRIWPLECRSIGITAVSSTRNWRLVSKCRKEYVATESNSIIAYHPLVEHAGFARSTLLDGHGKPESRSP